MDNFKKARVDTGDQIAGYIFMCSSKTKPDCFMYRVFGLPASKITDAEKIKPNMKLFLFDFDVKLLYGPYVADSSGDLDIEPYAFGGRFPSQVKFSITRDCLPLAEVAFKEAIRENYYGRSKFKQELNEEQVNKLISLFRPIGLPSPPPPSLVYRIAVESQHPRHRGSTLQITEFPSHRRYDARSDHINRHQQYRPSYVQEVPFPPRFSYKQVEVAGTHTLASQPYNQQHDPAAYVHKTYQPDHPRMYQHETHARYGTVIPQIASSNSYYAPNPIPQTHISHQQSQVAVPSSTFTSSEWVASASGAPQPYGGQTPSSGIPSSSNEVQLPYNNYHYGQIQGTHVATQWVDIASKDPQTLGGQTPSSGIPSSSNEVQLPYNNYYYGQTQGTRTSAQWVDIASKDPQTLGGQTPSTGIPSSSNEVQPPYNNYYHGQTQGTHTSTQWVNIASEAPQTLVGQTSSSGIPSTSNELQLPYSGYYAPAQGGSSVDNAYYNNGSSVASEYQYPGYPYQTSHQVVHSITSVEVYENAPAQVSEKQQTYQSQQLPVPQLSASADPGPGYAPTYYTGAYPTY